MKKQEAAIWFFCFAPAVFSSAIFLYDAVLNRGSLAESALLMSLNWVVTAALLSLARPGMVGK